MNKKICVATVQSPAPEGKVGHLRCVEKGLEFVHQSARAGARIICLPEYFGVFGLSKEN